MLLPSLPLSHTFNESIYLAALQSAVKHHTNRDGAIHARVLCHRQSVTYEYLRSCSLNYLFIPC